MFNRHGHALGLIAVFLVLLAGAHGVNAGEPDARLTVRVNDKGVAVSPLLYGIFFEEINRAGDGGLYAEMIQNRSFEDAATPIGWTLLKSPRDEAEMALDASRALNASNPTSLRLSIKKVAGRVGVCNEGFKGVRYGRQDDPKDQYSRFQSVARSQTCGLFVEQGKQYRLAFYCRGHGFEGTITATIEKQDGKVLAQKSFKSIAADWKKFETLLTASATAANARLVLATSAPGTLYFDMVSLFSVDTFNGHPNGTRKDLTQLIADMHPAFVRFPGGCYVEGEVMAEAFRWKNTLGDIAQRPGHFNLWGYRSNDGLGYHEYLQFCEDVGAEPLYVINCGMAHKDHVAIDKMDEYVQDALDAIEYANGPADSKWGAQRAAAGHPAPFGLKMMEIGNENGGPLYHERYALFYDAIKKRYPEIRLVVNDWQGMPGNRPVEILDEHYYNSPEFFFESTGKYDSYDRAKHKVYVGEYAVTQNAGNGNLIAALGEAAFMTGMERNGDVVAMASYAPLLASPLWTAWNPNAIVFDSARAYGTPSYHLQAMFAANRASHTVPLTLEAADPPRSGMIGVGTWETQAEFKDIRVVKDGQTLFASDFSRGMQDWKVAEGQWEVRDGALRQVGSGQGVRALAGGPDWADYTLTLKARKIGGGEGFLILFTNQTSHEKYWWNIGGWGNTRHSLEGIGLPAANVNGQIETGRWYDIRIETKGRQVKCYLDDKLIHNVARIANPILFATAGLSERGDELILKVVNGSHRAFLTQVSLKGLKQVEPQAQSIVLTGSSPEDENSFDEPGTVVPRRETVRNIAPEFRHTFPAYSVTILRIKRSGALAAD